MLTKQPIPRLIEETAHELCLEVHDSPFHAAEGLELRKQMENTDTLVCVGYFCGPTESTIYRRVECQRDIFFRNKLWFLYGWLIKPRPRDNQYQVLQEVSSSKFNETLFVDVVKQEFKKNRFAVS